MRISEARAILAANVAALRAIYHDLLGLQLSLPPSPEETSKEDLLGEPDPGTALRAALGAVLKDDLDPAIRDLSALADLRAAPPAPSGSPVVRLDLSASEPAMRRTVYALVVKDYFTARGVDDEPGEVWLPPYTPEQAGLEVWKAWGRWFAIWRKREVAEDAPEDEQWELLVLAEDPLLRGTLVSREI